MNYLDMVKKAVSSQGSEEIMWKSVAFFSSMLEELKESDPLRYWKIMRKQHELMHGKHYTEEFAMHDVNELRYKNKHGEECTGPHWSMEEVIDATEDDSFDKSITDGDKYVACNVIYADLGTILDEKQVLEVAIEFFFHDIDWGDNSKIWDYMGAKL